MICITGSFFFLFPSFPSVQIKSQRGLSLMAPMVKIFLINSGLKLELCFSWNGRCLCFLGSQADSQLSLVQGVCLPSHPIPALDSPLTAFALLVLNCINSTFPTPPPFFIFIWMKSHSFPTEVHLCPFLLGRVLLEFCSLLAES